MAGKVSFDDAIANADSPNNLRLRIKLATDGVAPPKAEAAVAVTPHAQPKTAPTSFGELSLQKIDDEDEPL
jgi:twitching motility protein PilU